MTTQPQSPSEQEIRALVRKDVEQMIHSQYKRDPKDTIESKIDRLGRRISALITQAADKREQEVRELQDRYSRADEFLWFTRKLSEYMGNSISPSYMVFMQNFVGPQVAEYRKTVDADRAQLRQAAKGEGKQ